MKFYKVGHIMTTHGIKGALKVKNLSDFDRFYKGSKLYILYNDDYISVTVEATSIQKDHLLVTFKDLLDINLVEKYRNSDIYISELDRADDLNDNEFYFSDLVGKMCVNENGNELGSVIEIREYPTSHYLVILHDGKNVLVPFIDKFIGDVLDDKIIIKEIEGLF